MQNMKSQKVIKYDKRRNQKTMRDTKKEVVLKNLHKLLSLVEGYPEYEDCISYAIEKLEQEPCEDAISRKSIKQKLQEHHDFFVNAYGGFSNLPLNDKSRVDEITNCIAMVINEPSVTPQERKVGHWILRNSFLVPYECSECNYESERYDNFCPNCGAEMVESQKSKK